MKTSTTCVAKTLQDPVLKRLIWSYAIALSAILGLAAGGQYFIQVGIDENRSDSQIINLAGRQRMLSQEIAKKALLITLDASDPNLEQTLRIWQDAHASLQGYNATLPAGNLREHLEREFAMLDVDLQALSTASRALLAGDRSRLPEIAASQELFLQRMDHIVTLYELSSRDKLTALKHLELILFLCTLLLIAIEAAFIFRPTLHLVREGFSQQDAAMKELRASVERERDALQAQKQLFANVSHEMRTPLNGISGALELLDSDALTAEQRDLIDTMRYSSSTLLRRINDLLDLSKLAVGELQLDSREFDLVDLLRHTVADIRPAAQAKQLALEVHIDPQLPQICIGDAPRLAQVLSKLLDNAVKFTETGTVTLRVTALDQTPAPRQINFQVSDEGIGIEGEKLSAIFSPFQQADASNASKYSGTGLGLSISSGLVARMGGHLTVASTPGEGSTFNARIPLRVVHRTTNGDQQDAQTLTPEALNLLVVDDNPVNLKVASAMLKKLGHVAITASGGQAAVDYVRDHPELDAIFMDVQMPEMDGLEATDIIRRDLCFNKPIIALSANALNEVKQQCLQVGMDDFVEKPATLERLDTTLAEFTGASPRHTVQAVRLGSKELKIL